MKQQNVLLRSSKMKSIGVNNDYTSSFLSITNTSSNGIQLIPGVTCRGECFVDNGSKRFDLVTVDKYDNGFTRLRLNKIRINTYFKSNIISYVGSLNSVVENIKTINLKGFIYDYKPINITYSNSQTDFYYNFRFNTKEDEANFINLIETHGRHVLRIGDRDTKLIKEGMFPEGLLYKEILDYNSIIGYSIRGDYGVLQLCSASSSYGVPVLC